MAISPIILQADGTIKLADSSIVASGGYLESAQGTFCDGAPDSGYTKTMGGYTMTGHIFKSGGLYVTGYNANVGQLVSFSSAFPYACQSVTVAMSQITGSQPGSAVPYTYNVSPTGFYVGVDQDADTYPWYVFWSAIGY